MRRMRTLTAALVVIALMLNASFTTAAQNETSDPLPSWNDTAPKQAILDFVKRVTTEGDDDFVPVEKRIATFDNDGTLWCEHPMYFQGMFVFDRVKALAPQHPEWKTQEPFKSILANDMAGLAASGEKGLVAALIATHSGMTTEQFNRIVEEWMATARHPKYHQPYNKCIYQPMHELLSYLRANRFKTFIVSGGGIEFMRPWTEPTYGIPPEQVVGSSGKLKFEFQDDRPILMKLPDVNFIDDGPGKPVGIQYHIGRRPIAAFGNSDGDQQMLEWTTAGDGARFGLIVHHTDGVREYAYDRNSHIGKLDKALDEAPKRGWTVMDMKRDWKVVFAFEK